MKTFTEFKEEMGGMVVQANIAGSGAESLPQDQKEPGVDKTKKKTSVMFKTKRTPPNM